MDTQEIIAGNIIINVAAICFKEGTKILCYNSNNKHKDIYVPIEDIKDNMWVKTYKHGYKRAKFIIKGEIINTEYKTINKMYKYPKNNNKDLIEDLYITGGHSLLYNKLTENQQNKMKRLIEKHNIEEYNFKIDDKYKLIAYYDDNMEEVMEDEIYNIYHLVLENENKTGNYGIYANGILVESTDEMTLYRVKGYDIINTGYELKMKDESNTNFKTGENCKINGNKMEKYLKNKMIENNTSQEDVLKKKEKIQKQQDENYEKECRKYKIHTHSQSQTHSYTQKVKINTNNKSQHKHN